MNFIVKINQDNRFTIPVEIRKRLGIYNKKVVLKLNFEDKSKAIRIFV